MDSTVRIRVLGSIEVDGRSINSPQERRLFALLALHRNRAVSVSATKDAVWGDDHPTSSRASLQSKISRLRTIVGADRVEYLPGGYRLRVEADECDADRFEALARGAIVTEAVDPPARLAAIDEALALWLGPPFGDLTDEPFIGGEAVRLEQLRATLGETRVHLLVDAGRYDEALVDLETLSREHPYRDRLCELRMMALARVGRVVDALRAFQDYQRRLGDDVGVAVTAPLIELERKILKGDFGPSGVRRSLLSRADPDAGSNGARPSALPSLGVRWNAPIAMRPTFVGREHTVAAIRRLLVRGPALQCLIVTGEAGVGKTRLVIETQSFARRLGRATVLLQCLRPPAPLFERCSRSGPRRLTR